MTNAPPTAALPDLEGFVNHGGVLVCDVGDDGDVVALGHPDAQTAAAAFRAHWGAAGAGWPATADIAECVEYTWAVDLTSAAGGCGGGWCLADDDGACLRCKEIREGPWWLEWGKTAETPGAFPVTLWRP